MLIFIVSTYIFSFNLYKLRDFICQLLSQIRVFLSIFNNLKNWNNFRRKNSLIIWVVNHYDKKLQSSWKRSNNFAKTFHTKEFSWIDKWKSFFFRVRSFWFFSKSHLLIDFLIVLFDPQGCPFFSFWSLIFSFFQIKKVLAKFFLLFWNCF